ncbi:hypothetical protein M2202_007532 [Bradyrhizobium japonicum]|jgi:hypothetical protein|uniref:Uncharacterized protein n=1 Tax=Bradyrhizobium japonicum TaxID=375 RepID=A0ABV2RQQ5_BRAJP|nr:hypothetical protein [Bradyrhizobium japonicum]
MRLQDATSEVADALAQRAADTEVPVCRLHRRQRHKALRHAARAAIALGRLMSSEGKPAAAGATTTTCVSCDDLGWVCENHPDRPWDGPRACSCGDAGAPSPACNAAGEGEVPRMPEGFRVEVDKDGWRH